MARDGKYRNWYMEKDGEGVAWLHFDKAGSGANTLSKEVLEELDSILDDARREEPKGLVVVSDKKNGFIAGADINEFVSLQNADEALKLIRRGQGLMDKMEGLPFPTVAMINGFCLGGGMELALACRYRVARSDGGTKLGLPEIKLGIHPGFGGTMRLTRLVGGVEGLDLMLSGRAVDARSALKTGMIDMAVPERHLDRAAASMALGKIGIKRKFKWKKLADTAPVRPYVAKMIRGKVERKAPSAHYPAPSALIDLWQNHAGDERRMLEEEAKSVAGLLAGSVSRNLVRVFFLQERLKGFGKKAEKPPTHIHVIGAGIMGGDIAAWSALRGMKVTIQDREARFLSSAMKRANELFAKKLKDGREARAAMDRLIPDVRGHGVEKADIILEAVFEDLEVKRKIFAEVADKARKDAIIATNTSSIPLEEMAEGSGVSERLVGIHFFNPVAAMQLVEVVRGASTSEDTFNRALAYVNGIGKLPLPAKSAPGFLVNRILMPYILEGVLMETEKIPAAAIDDAALSFGMPMGPLALADTVGLDICLHVLEIFGKYRETEIPQRLKDLVSSGKLGKKSGEGFYRYENGKPVRGEGVSRPSSGADITDRLILRYLNECAACLREGIVEDADLLDAGMIFGTGFAPFRGGPMRHATELGAEKVAERLLELEKKYGDRFRPDDGWIHRKSGD